MTTLTEVASAVWSENRSFSANGRCRDRPGWTRHNNRVSSGSTTPGSLGVPNRDCRVNMGVGNID